MTPHQDTLIPRNRPRILSQPLSPSPRYQVTPAASEALTAAPSAEAPFGVLVECFGGPWDGDVFWTRGNRVIRQRDGAYTLVKVRSGLRVTWAWQWA